MNLFELLVLSFLSQIADHRASHEQQDYDHQEIGYDENVKLEFEETLRNAGRISLKSRDKQNQSDERDRWQQVEYSQ